MMDREQLQRMNTGLAIEAFRYLEQKRLQLEMAEYKLEKAVSSPIDRDEYFRVTEEIRTQFEQKRDHYSRIGKLAKP